MLKISIESSSIGQKPAGAVDLITNKRTITTTVLIEDGGIVVLGGLIEDNSVKGEQRVPFLGNIPIIGLLFKTRNATSTKNNLMIFIRPKILRDQAQAAFETDSKYNYMRDQQRSLEHARGAAAAAGRHARHADRRCRRRRRRAPTAPTGTARAGTARRARPGDPADTGRRPMRRRPAGSAAHPTARPTPDRQRRPPSERHHAAPQGKP